MKFGKILGTFRTILKKFEDPLFEKMNKFWLKLFVEIQKTCGKFLANLDRNFSTYLWNKI